VRFLLFDFADSAPDNRPRPTARSDFRQYADYDNILKRSFEILTEFCFTAKNRAA